MKIVERFIDGEVYRIISIGRFSAASGGRLSDEVKDYLAEKGLVGVWKQHPEFGLFLESVRGFHEEARKLFDTEKVGVLVFRNDTEPDVPIDKVDVRKGDIIEMAYVGEGPESEGAKPHKQSFFEGSDKRQYNSPYKRETEWRRPKGAR